MAHNHALGAVDHESPLRRHQRDLAHINFLFLRAFLLPKLKSDMQRRAIGLALALGFERGQLRLANFVMAEIEDGLFVVTLDRKNFPENGLEPVSLALSKRDVFLEKIDV